MAFSDKLATDDPRHDEPHDQEERPGLEQATVYRADPDKVWAELLGVLAKVRATQSFPWDARRTLYWRTVFPQMTSWLPDDEAAQLRFAFEKEVQRLESTSEAGAATRSFAWRRIDLSHRGPIEGEVSRSTATPHFRKSVAALTSVIEEEVRCHAASR